MDPSTSVVVTARTEEAAGVIALDLRRPDGSRLPDWRPGAHIDLVLPNGLTRQYSLCGDPWDAFSYRVAVAREERGTGGSRYLHDVVRPGAVLGLGGPRNLFPLVPSPSYRFVAGGVGITPILPMLRQAEQQGAQWQLLYLGRYRERMAFLEDLQPYVDRVEVHVSTESGPADVAAWLGGLDSRSKVYACGPERLLATVEAATSSMPSGWVRMERYTNQRAAVASAPGPFRVAIASTGMSIEVGEEESVATALRRAGQLVLTSCSRGVCGTCEVGVTQGVPDHRDAILDDAERAANTCMFPCVSRALSDRLVLDL